MFDYIGADRDLLSLAEPREYPGRQPDITLYRPLGSPDNF